MKTILLDHINFKSLFKICLNLKIIMNLDITPYNNDNFFKIFVQMTSFVTCDKKYPITINAIISFQYLSNIQLYRI